MRINPDDGNMSSTGPKEGDAFASNVCAACASFVLGFWVSGVRSTTCFLEGVGRADHLLMTFTLYPRLNSWDRYATVYLEATLHGCIWVSHNQLLCSAAWQPTDERRPCQPISLPSLLWLDRFDSHLPIRARFGGLPKWGGASARRCV